VLGFRRGEGGADEGRRDEQKQEQADQEGEKILKTLEAPAAAGLGPLPNLQERGGKDGGTPSGEVEEAQKGGEEEEEKGFGVKDLPAHPLSFRKAP
jgi:hypothetical protein